jgi:peptidoglycan/xylan/chitin deacetylase (PgdA/CDA1 family)
MSESVPKRVVKLGVSCIVASFDLITRFRPIGLSHRHIGVVLLYHDVDAAVQSQFERQLVFLQKQTKVVSLDAFPRAASGEWHTAITFDDALASFDQVALPVCKSLDVPVTLFVPPGLLGTSGYMSHQEVASLPALVEVGSHSHLHRRLSVLTDAELANELVQSRDELQHLVGRPVQRLAYPFGDWNGRVADATSVAGYQLAYTVRPTCVNRDDVHFAVPRVTVEPTDWPVEFRLKVRGAYRWMGAVMALRQRVFGAPV